MGHPAMRTPFALLILALPLVGRSAEKIVDFNRDVRPILAGKCFACHGPDDKARKADLRLDTFAGAIAEHDGTFAVKPGKPAESELLARVRSHDPNEMMPPPKGLGKPVTEAEAKTLEAWIAQGGKYTVHWSYQPPVRRDPPNVANKSWVKNPIDSFVLARLEAEKLAPNAQADKATLLRRAALALTGLPPTAEERKAFFADVSPEAYAKSLDRLLASPAYGERWAAVWMDLARYADSQGFANDPDRTIWAWRDWVVRSFNKNQPFDQFTREMLAGDLIPNATAEQRLATGFHRNTLTNTEGGTNAEEFRSAAVIDRVNTTAQVWLGSTLACAQCHNHKYDPFSQKEYFQLYAVFNGTQDANQGSDAPTLELPLAGNEAKLKELDAKLADLKAKKAPPAEIKKLEDQRKPLITTVPVMAEGKMRPTKIQLRGDFKSLGDAVEPGLPAALVSHEMPKKVDRLVLADWIISPENPLTARVAVNRLWQELFGVGLVETAEEFGNQGDDPTHPALLDWLATELIRLKWDQKAMLKLIMSSATYMQDSKATAEQIAADPNNRFMGRGPRFRLSAEAVRDQALAVSGLLSPKMFGPPVQPPKPNFGLSAAFGGTTDWTTSPGEDRYRRALYTRQRRNAPYPSMTTFDAPERTFCSVRRIRTNTPLQALVTLNDPCFVEAAAAMGRRIMTEGGGSPELKVKFAWSAVLVREADAGEVKRVGELYAKAKASYAAKPAEARVLVTKASNGQQPKDDADAVEWAAWTVVANALLNLDETLTRR